ncbi:adhesion G protein-coupled receptor E1, partial [Chelydra serpentina]
VVLAAFTKPTGNGSQTIQMDKLDVQTKVIEDGCPEKDSVVSLEVKGETMKISCRTIQGTVAQARAGVAFASYVGMESILNGSFFHGQGATSVQMNSRVVSAFLTSQTKTDFLDPVNYTFQNTKPSSSADSSSASRGRPRPGVAAGLGRGAGSCATTPLTPRAAAIASPTWPSS